MIFTKAVHQRAKFQTSECSGEISPTLYFDRLLLLKVNKISARKVREELRLMILRSGSRFEEKPILCFRNNKNFVDFNSSTKKSKNFALSFVPFVQSI